MNSETYLQYSRVVQGMYGNAIQQGGCPIPLSMILATPEYPSSSRRKDGTSLVAPAGRPTPASFPVRDSTGHARSSRAERERTRTPRGGTGNRREPPSPAFGWTTVRSRFRSARTIWIPRGVRFEGPELSEGIPPPYSTPPIMQYHTGLCRPLFSQPV